MSFAQALRGRECGREYPITPSHVCEFCFGPLEVVYDYEAMRKAVSHESIARGPESVWRYRDLLPCEGEPVDLQAGFTPLPRRPPPRHPANAVAAHAARAGMEAFVFCPSDLEPSKLLGSKIYGANLVAVDGSYDHVTPLCSGPGHKSK